MAILDKRITELTAIPKPVPEDVVQIVDDVATTATNKKLGLGTFLRTYNRSAEEIAVPLSNDDLNFKDDHGDIRRYGALDDGSDTGPNITNALKTGHRVYVPSGTWTCDTNCILLTGSYIYGDGVNSILKHTITNGTLGVLTVNRAAPFGTSDPDNNIRDITVRDLKLLGTSVANGFSANNHLMPLRACSDTLIENVHFEEFQGDGLIITIGTGGEERHNRNITVRSCLFDGIDQTNRNCISVIDCDGLLIEDCLFQNNTTSGQPGAIDVEPNDVTQDIIRNITIKNNEFRNCEGGRVIGVATPAGTMTAKPYGHIKIENNYIFSDCNVSDASISVVAGETISTALDPMHILIKDNTTLSTDVPLIVSGVRGVKIQDNTFVDGSGSVIGELDSATLSVMDCEIEGNNWQDCSNTSGVLQIGSVEHLDIHNNVFNPKDTASHDEAIHLLGSGVTTVSKHVSIHENTFIKSTNQSFTVHVTSHTQDPDTCSYYENTVVDGPISLNDIDTIATFVSADATPDVSNSDVFFTNATGVTITRLDSGAIGDERTFISKGATVYDTSTATRLIGSTTDITTASGDITTWVCEVGGTSSSVWRLIEFINAAANNSSSLSQELVITTNVITAIENSTTFYLDLVGGFTSTLPAPAIGLKYKFVVKTAPTTAYIITTNSSANILFGTFLDIVGELVYFSAQDTLNFVASTSVVGDFLEVESDGTNWYCVAKSGADGGITVAVT